ncbi:hypothetical protein Poli38472_013825 [Pythium oligandrum]|uniref:TNFR-Cys domain-containing protein n=1 Tax=Pythium oligandrum TaxID=41045 RepID=A0A8K1FDN9_PYTOL|nr:hypothetical protein Poli38472_013825 [Pythium oligandrum]|eukprot:TMW55063.1 hypothetical protein Poli38472_013825 [Pythium oligandrum]
MTRGHLWYCIWLGIVALLCVEVAARTPGRFQFGNAVYSTSEDFGVALIAVQRHLGSDGRAAVSVSTQLTDGGNAVVGRDFTSLFNRSLVWEDGDDLDKELYVRILNDQLPQESSKAFTLYLHDASGASINTDRDKTQIILVPPSNLKSGSFRFLKRAVVANESNTARFRLPVVWEGGTTSKARAAYAVSNGTAGPPPDDYRVVSPAMLEWTRGGNTTQYIEIEIFDDDLYEFSENFTVRLLPPADLPVVVNANDPSSAFTLPAATLGNVSEVIVTIQGPNNVRGGVVQFDAPCFPACSSRTYQIMDGGLVRVYLQRRQGSDGAAQVRVRTVDGTAQAGVDYVALDQVIRWEEGDTSDKFVLIQAISGVMRKSSVAFRLELSEFVGGQVPGDQARVTTVTILGPSGIRPSEVDFVAPNALNRVLAIYDAPYLPLVTRLDSGIRVCPRVVVRRAGVVTLYLQRVFGSGYDGPASVFVQTIDGSAIGGEDYTPLPADTKVSWAFQDRSMKTVSITVLKAAAYYVGTRSFFVELNTLTNAALGTCHVIEVVLERVSPTPHVGGFELNMNTGKLTLILTNPVLASTLDASKLQLQNDTASAKYLEVFRLSKLTTTASQDGTTMVLDLTRTDLNALKQYKWLAKSAAATQLSMDAGAFDYVYESCTGPGLAACGHPKLEATPASTPLSVLLYTPDTTKPTIVSYTMDLTQRVVKLRFSEPVDQTAIKIEALGFSDSATGVQVYPLSSASSSVYRPQPSPLGGVRFSDGNPLPLDATYVTIMLGQDDIAGIQQIGNGQIGLQTASTFLSVASTFTRDLASPSNSLAAIQVTVPGAPALLQVAAADCSPCPANTFLSSSCSDMKDRLCSACRVCPTNSFALTACTPLQDTVCYPCTECMGGQYASSACAPTTDRVCSPCTRCTSDEYEASTCINGANRVCRTCDSCTLTRDQQRACQSSLKWKRRQMNSPYGCPLASQTYQTREAQLRRAKSNRCGAGRCSCSNSGVGNANPNADSFPNDPRCTRPAVYNINF